MNWPVCPCPCRLDRNSSVFFSPLLVSNEQHRRPPAGETEHRRPECCWPCSQSPRRDLHREAWQRRAECRGAPRDAPPPRRHRASGAVGQATSAIAAPLTAPLSTPFRLLAWTPEKMAN
ncbi:hypothetical protein PVAP13_4NG013200 [Panicum virgatum]|uniref:Uncharacterized protein n=1 Tax=Panicum virgatum TaxID=38727 RepID=A0A8T0T0E4_PANVG|nr:hypothetical protein PVAP13_4NG013200 [Panicum virgatum]